MLMNPNQVGLPKIWICIIMVLVEIFIEFGIKTQNKIYRTKLKTMAISSFAHPLR